ncbi:MarR family winged helix-turn-helix transcriptional regulator [Pelagibacteraceae bacterium]|nr:MarR family winged helix-turn-helix transcriptional regulator [Pelagibacteraceae bacterium]
MSDLNFNNLKGSPLLYLREDKVKESLNTFFNVSKNFEKIITDNINNETFGIADIRCLLIINLNPGIIFNKLMKELDISKQSLNRVLKKLILNNFIIQKINSEDARKKNLYLSNQTNKMLDNILEPILKDISEAFQKSGSNSVQGFNQIINNIVKRKENDA